ncbi:MAG: DoxX family protein [Acidimicrobiales bacterium]
MTVQRIARPLLASIFIAGGIDALLDPGPKAQVAEPLIDRMAEQVRPVAQKVAAKAVGEDGGGDGVPQGTTGLVATEPIGGPAGDLVAGGPHEDEGVVAKVGAVAGAVPGVRGVVASVDETMHEVAEGAPLPVSREAWVRANGVVQVGAGILLAVNRVPRLASLALTASLVPTTLGGHRFWEAEGDERRLKRIAFTKNLGLLGGLLLSAAGGSWECPDPRGAKDGRTKPTKPTMPTKITKPTKVTKATKPRRRRAGQGHHLPDLSPLAVALPLATAGHLAHEASDKVVDVARGASKDLAGSVRHAADAARDVAGSAREAARDAAKDLATAVPAAVTDALP